MRYPKTPEWTDEMEARLQRVEILLKVLGDTQQPTTFRGHLARGLAVAPETTLRNWEIHAKNVGDKLREEEAE